MFIVHRNLFLQRVRSPSSSHPPNSSIFPFSLFVLLLSRVSTASSSLFTCWHNNFGKSITTHSTYMSEPYNLFPLYVFSYGFLLVCLSSDVFIYNFSILNFVAGRLSKSVPVDRVCKVFLSCVGPDSFFLQGFVPGLNC